MFRKTAQVRSLGRLEAGADGQLFSRTRRAQAKSFFADGSRKIPFGDLLARVAKQYAISDDPTHYLLEAIRANTTNVPNENNDGFHQSELLRHDTRLGMPVYLTYVGKPHHVNHKTDNPKEARGLIVDAHYHDSTPPLDACPRCRLATAQRSNRDQYGIHCKRCGHVVKDEFVEILVGVDTKKDASFADGVRSGQLDAGSMGCNCLSTSCNVCGKVAYSRPEFCEHIRAAKGSLWQKKGSLWSRIAPITLEHEIKKRGLAWDPTDFCYLTYDGFEVRRAFEYCQNVVFDEYSRVDQPADPKARQREILRMQRAARLRQDGSPDAATLAAETEALLRATSANRAAGRRTATMKTANRFVVIRVNGDDSDIHAAESLEAALATAGVDENAAVEHLEVEAMSPEEACSMFDSTRAQSRESDVVVQAPPDEAIVVQPTPPGGPGGPGGEPGAPGALPGGPPAPGGPTIDQLQQQPPGAVPGNEQLSPAEMGMVPPGAGQQSPISPRARRSSMRRFVNAYQGWTVEITTQGNARVFTASKNGKPGEVGHPILVIRGEPEPDARKRHARCREIMSNVLELGVVEAAKRLNAIVTPRIAQVVDGAIDDMKEFADKYTKDSVLDDHDDDMQDDRETPPDHVPDDNDDDMQDARGTPPSSTQDDGIADHDRGTDTVDSVTQEDNTDMAEKRDKLNLGKDTVLDDEIHNHTEKLSRLAKLGGLIAHKDRPQIVWTVRLAALDAEGKVEVSATAEGQKPRKIGQADLLAYWKSLDKPLRALNVKANVQQIQALRDHGIMTDVRGGKLVTVATNAELAKVGIRVGQLGTAAPSTVIKPKAPTTPPGVAAPPSTSGPSVAPAGQAPAEPLEPSEPKLGKRELAILEARSRKAWIAKEAKLAKDHERALALERHAAINGFCRALRIIARRQDAGLEESVLRQATENLIAAPRQLPVDAGGMPVAYPGMDLDLARYVTAEIMRDGRPGDLENLMLRAAELMERGDAYLCDAEADVQNLAPRLPAITAASVVPPDPYAFAAEQYRQAAAHGNFAIVPQPVPEGPQFGQGNHDKRSAIRGAVSGTLVNGTLDRLRSTN